MELIKNDACKSIQVPPKSQLDVVIKDFMKCKLLCGDAEIQGFPLETNEEYSLPSGGLGIHSWHGCKLEISGNFVDEPKIVDAKQNCMIRYVNLHAFLEGKRDTVSSKAIKVPKSLFDDTWKEDKDSEMNEHKGDLIEKFSLDYDQLSLFSDSEIDTIFNLNIDSIGPRLMILGPVNSGKSTLCKTIVNYAYRKSLQSSYAKQYNENENENETETDNEDYNDTDNDNDESGIPLFVDLDPGQNMLGLPGTCVAEWMNHYIEPFDKIYEARYNNSFSYFHGTITPNANGNLYRYMIHRLSVTCKKKLLSNQSMRNGGMIINTCGYIAEPMFPTIKHIINTFSVNAIAVLQHEGQDPLINFLQNYCKTCKYPIHCSTLPVSSAISQSKSKAKGKGREKRDAVCKHYFYGNDYSQYMPYSRTFSFSDLKIYKISDFKTENNKDTNKDKDKKGKFTHNDKKDSCLVKVNYNYNYHEKGDTRNEKKENVNESESDNKSESVETKTQTFEIYETKFKDKMAGNIVAITYAQKKEELLTANIAGFICIKNIDFDNKSVECLCSCIGKFPGLLVDGDINVKTLSMTLS